MFMMFGLMMLVDLRWCLFDLNLLRGWGKGPQQAALAVAGAAETGCLPNNI